MRCCALSRAVLPKERMLRLVVGPERVLMPDFAERLPGRGIWLNAEGDMIETARAHGLLARAIGRRRSGSPDRSRSGSLGAAVTVPNDLCRQLVAGLERRIAELLGFAWRAGLAAAGFGRVGEWYAAGCVGLLLVAEDASGPERARFLSGVPAGLSGAALGAVFGRERLAHVAVRRGRLAAAIESAARRRAGLAGVGSRTDGVHDGRQ